jgi:HD domain
MSNLSSALVIPDSLLAKEATGILREYSSDLIFNHSVRVYLFATEHGRRQKLRFDAELLYIAAAFHDLGLSKKFSSESERFEVDGANAARQFLSAHNVPEDQVRTVWQAIALHTTPGITQHMQPEVALLYSGVGLDVLGRGFDQFPAELREQIVARYPRRRFKEAFIREYFAGFAHKPQTTYGTVNAGVCERYLPGFKSPNACDLIAASPFPDSE